MSFWSLNLSKHAFLVACTLFLASCVETNDQTDKQNPETAKNEIEEKSEEVKFQQRLEPVSFAALPGWEEDQVGQSLEALARSCATFLKMPKDKAIGPLGLGGRAGDWVEICKSLEKVYQKNHDQARKFYEENFQPFLVSDLEKEKPATGLFTGYYEAGLRGSKVKSAKYSTPIYKRPEELVLVNLGEFKDIWNGKRLAGRLENGKLVPYASRKEIEKGYLSGRGLELVWVDDAADAFFLHIQGSGRVSFEDGSSLRIGYDGHNGHDYTSIGRVLIDRGEVEREKMSLQAIREWMVQHPDQANALMDENASYIFFKELKGAGPIGAQGVALTPGRSLAVDRRFMSLGVPIFLYAFTDPVDHKPIARMMVAQDTGGAIKGVIRGDIFWGFGEEARERAGKMKEEGSYFAFLPLNTLDQCQVCDKPQE